MRSPIDLLPIQTKLLIAFLAVLALPVIIMIGILNISTQQADRANLERYMQDEGSQRQHAIEGAFEHIIEGPSELITNFSLRNLVLLALFTNGEQSDSLSELEEFINDELTNSQLFDWVILVHREGRIVLSEGQIENNEFDLTVGENISDSVPFFAARSASVVRAKNRFVVNGDNLDLVLVVYSDNEPVGYIIGRINLERSLLETLAPERQYLNPNSYLVTVGGDVALADAEYLTQAEASAPQVSSLADALTGEAELDRYVVDGIEYIGYVSNIEDTPFALITEIRADTRLNTVFQDAIRQPLLFLVVLVGATSLLSFFMTRRIVPPLKRLQTSLRALRTGDYSVDLSDLTNRGDEIGDLARTLDDTRLSIQESVEEIERQAQARVRDLEATQELGRYVTQQRDVDVLMNNVVDLIVERFEQIYHAQIFLLDNERDFAVLRASTGEPGQQLLARGHRLQVGSLSVIGQVTQEMRTVVARDATTSQVHRANEFLPDTRAELAIPLRVGNYLIGALDVQSKSSHSFNQEEIGVLETLANQIAIAIENARLYQESVQRLEEVERVNRAGTLHDWREYLGGRREQNLIQQVGAERKTDVTPLQQLAYSSQETAIGAETEFGTIPLVVPIVLRGQTLGAVDWEIPSQHFSEETVQLAESLVNRLALSLDNARLFQASQRSSQRERLVNDIATRLTSHTDIDEILQTAVREVGQALHAPRVSVQLGWGQNGHKTSSSNGDGGQK